MSTRNFTSVIMDGRQVVCQYGQLDGYPSYTGAKILEFLRDADMERFKEALRNTKMIVTRYVDSKTYTGSTKMMSDIGQRVWDEKIRLNKERKADDEHINTYKTVKHMFKNGELTAQEVDDFLVSTRDTGCDILPFIYERSLDAAPLELFAIKEEFGEVKEFATNKNYVGFPGCDAQGYYMINLDDNTVKLAFDDYVCEYTLDNLPQNIDKEMFIFDKATRVLYGHVCDGMDFEALIPDGEDEKGAGGLWDLAADVAVEIGLWMRNEYPELLGDAEKDGPIYAEDFGQELIYKILCNKIEAQRVEKEHNAAALNELKAHIENLGWSVSDCHFSGNAPGWEISQYSPAGEDFSFAIEHNNSFKHAINEIRDYDLNFDAEEHVEMLIEARRNGFAGVPDNKTLVKDADAIEEMLSDLARDVEKWAPMHKKPALDDVISACQKDVNAFPLHPDFSIRPER